MPAHIHIADGTPSAALRVLVDHSVIEAYDSVSAMSGYYFPKHPEGATGVQLFCNTGGGVRATMAAWKVRAAVVH